jgi:radical SAM protein with 4Fe4S-binding SPASM domain
MTLGEFARVTANLKGITEYLYFHVLGEPLTHPLLPVFIEHAKRCGYKVALTTNGTLLQKRGEELLLTKPYKINISLHSFEGEDARSRRAYIDFCLNFAKRASDEGILVVLRLWNLSDEGILDGNIEALNGEVINAIREKFGEYESVSVRGARIKDKLHIEFGKRFDWPDRAAEDGGEQVFCHGLGDHFGILSDGSVVPCCLDAEGDITLGNIFEEDVRAILKSERATRISDGFAKKTANEELCRRCGYARRFKI